ncbi:NMDA receptor synaptonuclear signaling and neuronal migration factor-like [Apostichopus japonicus]|uniref:NMDA receptor synaptonuclear signaling and neuronal migration factor-like n=1 Tax=Stichopus japonicus TaxID=307972 RepID=UPI003AB1E9E4
MGSGSSKKARKVSTVITATAAFEDAGKKAATGRDEGAQNKNKGEDGGNQYKHNGTDSSQNSNGHVLRQDNMEDTHSDRQQDGDQEQIPKEAVVKIQSVFRGYQDRQLLKKQSDMAIKIQRRFRRHMSQQTDDGETKPKEDKIEEQKEDLDKRRDDRENRARAWRDDTPELLRRKYSVHVGEKTQEEFKNFQDEITELRWKAEQQIERNVYGDTHSPRRVLFISSNVQKSSELTEAGLPDVLTFHYDFTKDTFENLIKMLELNLEAYKPGSRARSICFVSQGGPGVLYLLKKRALTVPKLKKESEADQVRFWESVGRRMSKVSYQDSIIHVMGNNVMGNEKGQLLFDSLETIMMPSVVKFKAPLELSEEGQEMISSYFDLPKYKTWKMRRYSKTE